MVSSYRRFLNARLRKIAEERIEQLKQPTRASLDKKRIM
jgi:hypothetical protein